MLIDDLRSPPDRVRGICYFGRMLDKIRPHTACRLPADYHGNLGGVFDARCCSFVGVDYVASADRVKAGGSDEEVLDWCFTQGRAANEEAVEVWNEFMRKRGWNDEATPTLQRRLREGGYEDRSDIQTFFDFIDLDEGRDPRGGG